MNGQLITQYLCLGIFVLIMIGVGIYSAKKVNNVNDFFLAGRGIGPWMSGFCYGTTYFSAVIFIGYAGTSGWQFGFSAIWIGIGNALLGSFLAWKVLARRTRDMTHKLNASTMPEFFEKRFNSPILKVVSAVIIFVFLVPYSASVYKGLTYLFETVFRLDFTVCMVIMAALTGIYLILGGVVATVINDFIQGIIMLTGIVAIVIYVIVSPQVGGFETGIERLGEVSQNYANLFGGSNWLNLLIMVLLTSLGTWGLPQMIHKFYTVRDNKAIKVATIVSTVFAAIVATGCYLIGSYGHLFFDNLGKLPDGKSNYDVIVPGIITSINLPAILLGIIAVLVLSASMSTLSSLVLVSSSAISMDLCKGSLFKKMSEKSVMILMRILCGVFVLLSLIIALIPNNPIVSLMAFSWGALAGSFLAPYLYGLYWKKTSTAGVWAGIIVGLACSIGFSTFGGLTTVQSGVVAMVVSLIIVPVASLLTPSTIPENMITQPEGEILNDME